MFSLLKRLFQLESAVVHETPEGAVDLGSGVEETEVRHKESKFTWSFVNEEEGFIIVRK